MFTKHVKNMRIMDMEDEGVLYQVATRIGADHLGCCGAYALIGMDKLTEMGIKTENFSFDFL